MISMCEDIRALVGNETRDPPEDAPDNQPQDHMYLDRPFISWLAHGALQAPPCLEQRRFLHPSHVPEAHSRQAAQRMGGLTWCRQDHTRPKPCKRLPSSQPGLKAKTVPRIPIPIHRHAWSPGVGRAVVFCTADITRDRSGDALGRHQAQDTGNSPIMGQGCEATLSRWGRGGRPSSAIKTLQTCNGPQSSVF